MYNISAWTFLPSDIPPPGYEWAYLHLKKSHKTYS